MLHYTIVFLVVAIIAGISAKEVVVSSTAILFRVVTFWIRIPLGWFALRHCQKKNIV